MNSCHLFLISSASVRFLEFLSFTVPIFAWNILLIAPIFLKRSLLLLLNHFSHVRLCVTPSLGFSRQELWSGLPFPSPMRKSEKWKWSRSVMSDSSRPHGLQPTRLLRPWDFPGKSTRVGCHCLIRKRSLVFPTLLLSSISVHWPLFPITPLSAFAPEAVGATRADPGPAVAARPPPLHALSWPSGLTVMPQLLC